MTVAELIENLKTMDPELRVFTAGYEGGYNDVVFNPTIRDIALNFHSEWYYGEHEAVDVIHSETKETHEIVKGIVL